MNIQHESEGIEMLMEMKIENFLSFGERMTSDKNNANTGFSLIADNQLRSSAREDSVKIDGSDLNVLRLAMICGKNGSGKSNFVKAAAFIQQTVLHGLPDGYRKMFNKTKADNRSKPSLFEIQFRKGNRKYRYGFEVLLEKGAFIREWLYEIADNGTQTLLFDRDVQKEYVEVGEVFRDAYSAIQLRFEDLVQEDELLFLTEINQNRAAFYKKYPEARRLKDAYEWFKDDLCIVSSSLDRRNFIEVNRMNFCAQLTNVMNAFGYEWESIVSMPRTKLDLLAYLPEQMRSDVEMELEQRQTKNKDFCALIRAPHDLYMIQSKQENAPQNEMNSAVEFHQLLFKYKGSDALFRLSDESEGTADLIALSALLLTGRSRTFVIDDYGRNWHPLLAKRFAEMILDASMRNDARQLIATTHHTIFLQSGQLGANAVWFLDKEEGNSQFTDLKASNMLFKNTE